MTIKLCEQCFAVAAEDGHVLVEGQHGLAATLTPEAAIDSADRMLEEASTALGQRTMARVKREVERR